MRVYQFHHYGIEIIRFLQHGLLPIPETTYEVSYQKLTFQTLTPHLTPTFTPTFTPTWLLIQICLNEVRLCKKYI